MKFSGVKFSGGVQTSSKLHITDLDLLLDKDCDTMSRFVQVEQFPGFSEGDRNLERIGQFQAGGVFSPISLLFQLCAGKKIQNKTAPLFFTYSGKGRGMTFKPRRPLKDWIAAHVWVSAKGKLMGVLLI